MITNPDTIDVAGILRRHTLALVEATYCSWCTQDWPCDTIQALRLAARLAEALAVLDRPDLASEAHYVRWRETDGPCETCGKHFGGDSSHPFLGKKRVCGHEENAHTRIPTGYGEPSFVCIKCSNHHAYQPPVCEVCNGTGVYSESGRGSDGPEPCPVCSGGRERKCLGRFGTGSTHRGQSTLVVK